MKTIKIILKYFFLFCLVLAVLVAGWYVWWTAPINIHATSIQRKALSEGLSEERAKNIIQECESFHMTLEEFNAYWKNVRPIFDVDAHSYSSGDCYFFAIINKKKYKIFSGGMAEITKDGENYYYVGKNQEPDLRGDSLP